MTANYPISSVHTVARDAQGKTTYERYAHPSRTGSFFYDLFSAISVAPVSREQKGDRVEVTVQYGNGEVAVLYQSK